jgi:hypothetical protein
LKEAHRLLREDELRALASHFERDAVELMERTVRGTERSYRVINPASAIGLVAEALRDPHLYEQSIRIYSPEPNELQRLDIAAHHLECGDAEGSLRWLQGPWREASEYERLRLLDGAYALTGDIAKQIEIRRNAYQRTRSVHTYRYLRASDFPGEGAAQNRLYINGTAVNGRISESDDGPTVVVDGREYSWEEFGRFLSPFTGFNFRLECFDASAEPETTPNPPRPDQLWWLEKEEVADGDDPNHH